MRTHQFFVFPLSMLFTVTFVMAKPWFFVPLSVETHYPNGNPHQHHASSSLSSPVASDKGVGVDSWAFVGSRNDPADDMENRCECATSAE